MITKLELTNYGPLAKLEWDKLGKINLAIGGNSSGKTFLLKALYSAMRTLEEYRRGDDQRTEAEILAEKLLDVSGREDRRPCHQGCRRAP